MLLVARQTAKKCFSKHIQHIDTWTKWPPICQKHFFLFWSKLCWILSTVQYVNISSGNGLMSSGKKPLSEQILNIHDPTWTHHATMSQFQVGMLIKYSKISVFKSNWCHSMILLWNLAMHKWILHFDKCSQSIDQYQNHFTDMMVSYNDSWQPQYHFLPILYPHSWYKCQCLLYLLSVKQCQYHRWRMVNHPQSNKMAHIVVFLCHSKERTYLNIFQWVLNWFCCSQCHTNA